MIDVSLTRALRAIVGAARHGMGWTAVAPTHLQYNTDQTTTTSGVGNHRQAMALALALAALQLTHLNELQSAALGLVCRSLKR